MRRLLDIGLCAFGFSFGIAIAVLSAFVSSEYRWPLLALGIASSTVALVQGARSIRSGSQHERAITELRQGQEYLAQPESHRQMQLLFSHHEALRAADARFWANFDVEEPAVGLPTARCKQCDWQTQEALFYACESGLAHLDQAHSPPAKHRRRLVPFGQ